MLDNKAVEEEILKALLESSHYPLAGQLFVKPTSGKSPLLSTDVEEVVLTSAMHHYDNASNGNRTRGGMKRANDIVAAFRTSLFFVFTFPAYQGSVGRNACHVILFTNTTAWCTLSTGKHQNELQSIVIDTETIGTE